MAAISTFALVGTAVAGIVSAVGSIVQGAQQASVARFNQGIARQNAEIATQQAREDAERTRRDTRRRIGSIEAAFGASGIEISGSAFDVIDDNEIEGELDALTVLYRGSLESRRFQTQATDQGFRAQTAQLTGFAGAAGALLSSTGRIGERIDTGGSTPSARIGGSQPVSTRNAFA